MHRFFLTALIAVLSLSPSGWCAGADPRDALLERIRAHVLTEGEVHALYFEPVKRVRFLVGFDFSSGAWYLAWGDTVVGRDPQGREFQGRPLPGRVTLYAPGSGMAPDCALDGKFPFVITRDLASRPEVIENVREAENGDISFSATFPAGKRGMVLPAGADLTPKTVSYRVGRFGELISASNYGGGTREWTWSYEAPGDRERGIASRGGAERVSSPQLVEFRHEPVSDPGRFSASAVESLAYSSLAVTDRQPLWFGRPIEQVVARARKPRAGAEPNPTPAVSQASGSGAMSSRHPAPNDFSASAAVCGIGCMAWCGALWWKRRRRSAPEFAKSWRPAGARHRSAVQGPAGSTARL